MPKIQDTRILIMATNGVEQSELLVPRDQLRGKGAKVDVASPKAQPIRAWQIDDWGETVKPDCDLDSVNPADYAALVIPGGQINPDLLRVNQKAMGIVKSFLESGKVVAAICHGPWLLAEADALRGREVTSYKSIRKDIENAGGRWVDREVVVDKGIVTSRSPDDLPAFVAKIVEEVQEGQHKRAA
ncbi:type 1 glutamine amidotransferase domain-containing protein [uncultured Ferrovibrio sp.]|jgi:protease I|uniref:type 1 glutamine amidotransferase domain-containing protein n=1 Tax=uncultured Ferrovibrio sp. TaxID=1576913 RepID=UPI0026136036|nr:type 1 glutamine amidotransferase domain-containing protein [uncultured Ferrovibrio sp.]